MNRPEQLGHIHRDLRQANDMLLTVMKELSTAESVLMTIEQQIRRGLLELETLASKERKDIKG